MGKTIGLLVQKLDRAYGLRESYYKFAQQWGKVVLVTPDMSPEDIKLDLLILPGGADLSLALQTTLFDPKQGHDDPSYTYFADNSLKEWVEAKVPIFGICLGFQMLVNELGGKLTLHIDDHDTPTGHYIYHKEDAEVGIEMDFEYVNSRHHQGYMLSTFNNLPKTNKFLYDFIPLAFSAPVNIYAESSKKEVERIEGCLNTNKLRNLPIGTVVEAFRHRDLKIAGVQWHPEDLTNKDNVTRGDTFSRNLINWLLNIKPKGTADIINPNTPREGKESKILV